MRWVQRRVDYVVVILPFEVELYRRAGVPCAFVGHPLLDEVAPSYDRDRLRATYGLPREACVIGLLPGSRAGEVRALLPVMLEAARLLQGQGRLPKAILAAARTGGPDPVQRLCEGSGLARRLVARAPNGDMAPADRRFL